MTIELPTNPDIDQLRRQAEELLQQARSGVAAALDRLGTSAHSGAALSLGRRLASTRMSVRVPEMATPPPRGCRRPGSNHRPARRPPRLRRQDDRWRRIVHPLGNSTMFPTLDDRPQIGVTCLSPGATTMIGLVENQVALGGADRFVIVGTAGSILPDVAPGMRRFRRGRCRRRCRGRSVSERYRARAGAARLVL